MIRAEDVSVERGGRRLVDRVSLHVAPGEMLGIVGPNGAGKSTLVKVLSGEIAPSRGMASFDGRPLAAWRGLDLARRRAVLPQSSSVGFVIAAAAVIALGRIPHAGIADAEQDRRAILRAMEMADIQHLGGRVYHTLSGGEQQRVHLARVLAQIDAGMPRAEGAGLLLDEPTASLDLKHQHAVMRAARMQTAHRTAVVAVMHDLNLAAAYCDRIAVMSGGRLVALGGAAEVLEPALLEEVFAVPMRLLPHPTAGDRAVIVCG